MGDFPLTSLGTEGRTEGLVTQAQTWDLFLLLTLLANLLGFSQLHPETECRHPCATDKAQEDAPLGRSEFLIVLCPSSPQL